MKRLEERLREAAHAEAARVDPDTVPPLRLPRRRRMGTFPRWLTPLAVAASLVAIVATVTLISDRTSRLSWGADSGGAPRFYLAGATDAGGGPVSVYDARTGHPTATVPAARVDNGGYWQIASAGDDRTFVLTSLDQRRCESYFTKVKLTNDGRLASATELPGISIHGLPEENGLAVTRKFTEIAYAVQKCGYYAQRDGPEPPTDIEVIALETGARRVWRGGAGWFPAMSWTADQRTLAVQLSWTGRGAHAVSSGVWLIDTTKPGNDPRGDPMALLTRKLDAYYASATISPNGKTIVAAGLQVTFTRTSEVVPVKLTVTEFPSEIRTTTGPTHNLYVHTYTATEPPPTDWWLAVDGTGRHVLLTADDTYTRLDSGGGQEVLPTPWLPAWHHTHGITSWPFVAW